VGYQPKPGDKIVVIEDVITAGTAIRESMEILKAYGDIQVSDMFISVNRCEVGLNPAKTAVMEVQEAFGIRVHPIITVTDIRDYLRDQPAYAAFLPGMDAYMERYCLLNPA
jgi:orotate phosphoribosyltransferase